MRQRVVIALALAPSRKLIVADEPTTALDVSIQAQIISLLKRLCKEHGAAVMLVTHDMGVIAETCDRVAVLYAGRVAEIGPVQDVIHHPATPTRPGLMGSIPAMDEDRERLLQIDGSMPRLNAIPPAAPSTRAARRPSTAAAASGPELLDAGATRAACWLVEGRPHERRCAGDAGADGRGRGPAKVFDVSAPWLNRVVERKPRQFVHAVDGVSFSIERAGPGPGGRVGLRQEHGGAPAGGPVPADPRQVRFDGRTPPPHPGERALRRRMQMIFQDPYASLNPRWKVLDIVAEPLREHGLIQGPDALKAAWRNCCCRWAWRGRRARSFRTSSPAASASASRSPARWPPSPSSWSATSRPRRSTCRCRRRC
jgi:ABC-type dipeptide/oligopeptide/nickel transport system ATPase component